MKILHYTGVYAPAWKWGGPPRSTANLCEGLAEAGNEVTVFTTDAGLETEPGIPRNQPVIRNGVTVYYFQSEHGFSGIRSSHLENAVVEGIRKVDLLHVTGVWQPTSVAACRAAHEAGVPYVVSPRGALGRYSFTQKPWKKWPYWWLHERRNCRRAFAIHYTSAMEMEECARFRFPGRAFVVPNSIDFTDWWRDEEAGRRWRSELGVGESCRVFLYAGRIHHKKGLDLLPEVATAIREHDFRMVFLGRDEEGTVASLDSAFRSAGIRDRVVFLPMANTEGLRAAYSGSDRFLLPSRHENFGNVAVEALACGCPVLLSNCTGVAGALINLPGVEILPRVAAAWVGALNTISTSPVRGLRDAVKERFSSRKLTGDLVSNYEALN